MRGTLQGEAPYQDATAQKLFETLDLCANTGGHSRTYGALDPVQAATMAPKLTSIYVSGWQCSSTSSSSNEPGPDFADYPYDTVLTQRGFLQFLNLNVASMASMRLSDTVTPSTWRSERLRVV